MGGAAGGRPQRAARLVGRGRATSARRRSSSRTATSTRGSARRFELTAKAVEPNAAAVVRVETAGETRLERLMWAVMLGDLVSLELARQRGVDPLPVEAIERFKEEMG